MRFVDLFAGLGGFHLALHHLGHECVLACEVSPVLQDVYYKNFGIQPVGDIRTLSLNDIPSHEILCAGFPCQPFSKAGAQQGFDHPLWGDLFGYVLNIIQSHKPNFVILENVPNLKHHDEGSTWKRIKSAIEAEGYFVDDKRLSPHRLGIPQIRERMYIVGSRLGLSHFMWPVESLSHSTSIKDILDDNPADARELPKHYLECLNVWDNFLQLFPEDEALPTFPIWTMEFGATYPYEDVTPYVIGSEHIKDYRGTHGVVLKDIASENVLDFLPSYARVKQQQFPHWKIQYIRQNRELYERHKNWIDTWLPQLLQFPASLQKFEWNCKAGNRNIWEYVIQFRASGVRVKRPTTSPSLVAMTTTQVPIIGWQKRYMTPRECARLQSMDELRYLPDVPSHAFNALGNAVNVSIVKAIALSLLETNGDFVAERIE